MKIPSSMRLPLLSSIMFVLILNQFFMDSLSLLQIQNVIGETKITKTKTPFLILKPNAKILIFLCRGKAEHVSIL